MLQRVDDSDDLNHYALLTVLKHVRLFIFD